MGRASKRKRTRQGFSRGQMKRYSERWSRSRRPSRREQMEALRRKQEQAGAGQTGEGGQLQTPAVKAP